MSNQQAVVDQIVRNLAFDIEAVPKNKSIQTSSISQSTPLNVKIKVRKKDEIQKYQEVSSITDDTTKTIQKVRLVNSDRTIMTFDVFMEAEFEKKPSRKFHKQIFDILRPGDDFFIYSLHVLNEYTVCVRIAGVLLHKCICIHIYFSIFTNNTLLVVYLPQQMNIGQ